MKEETTKQQVKDEQLDNEVFREICAFWQRECERTLPPPPTVQQIRKLVEKGVKTSYDVHRETTRRYVVWALTLLLAAVALACIAVPHYTILMWLSVLLGLLALCQVVSGTYRLYLFWCLDDLGRSPYKYRQCLNKLIRSEEWSDRCWQPVSRLFSQHPLPQRTLCPRINSALVAACLLLIVGASLWYQPAFDPVETVTYGTMQCNNDCEPSHVLSEVYDFYRQVQNNPVV